MTYRLNSLAILYVGIIVIFSFFSNYLFENL